jgi:hypothetical protein
MHYRAAFSLLFGLGLMFAACSEPALEVGYDDPRPQGGGAGMNAGGAGGLGGECVKATCQGKGPYACGDCQDNDGDKKIDAADPECLGACDNTEDKFYGGIPGQNGASCRRDCYFDQDSGNGNDRCEWSLTCDMLSPSSDPACAYDPNAAVEGGTCASLRQDQNDQCLETCMPLTPNGCDCFGCCELPARSNIFVWLGTELNGVGSCDAAHLDDPTACARCTPVLSCLNRCDACEVCAGKTSVDAGCASTTPLCSVGVPCGPGATCSGTAYCITGCCIEVPR